MSNTKQALIKTNVKNFFNHWLILTKPLHKLKPQEISVLYLLIYYYFEFKKDMTNDELAWKLTFDYDTKVKIKDELNIKVDQSITNILYSLRKKKVIVDNKVSKSFIPNIDFKTSNTFTLVYKFEIEDDK